jgi:hypothetical protein
MVRSLSPSDASLFKRCYAVLQQSLAEVETDDGGTPVSTLPKCITSAILGPKSKLKDLAAVGGGTSAAVLSNSKKKPRPSLTVRVQSQAVGVLLPRVSACLPLCVSVCENVCVCTCVCVCVCVRVRVRVRVCARMCMCVSCWQCVWPCVRMPESRRCSQPPQLLVRRFVG